MVADRRASLSLRLWCLQMAAVCSECKGPAVTVQCTDCKALMCTPCDARVHGLRLLSAHVRAPYTVPAAPAADDRDSVPCRHVPTSHRCVLYDPASAVAAPKNVDGAILPAHCSRCHRMVEEKSRAWICPERALVYPNESRSLYFALPCVLCEVCAHPPARQPRAIVKCAECGEHAAAVRCDDCKSPAGGQAVASDDRLHLGALTGVYLCKACDGRLHSVSALSAHNKRRKYFQSAATGVFCFDGHECHLSAQPVPSAGGVASDPANLYEAADGVLQSFDHRKMRTRRYEPAAVRWACQLCRGVYPHPAGHYVCRKCPARFQPDDVYRYGSGPQSPYWTLCYFCGNNQKNPQIPVRLTIHANIRTRRPPQLTAHCADPLPLAAHAGRTARGLCHRLEGRSHSMCLQRRRLLARVGSHIAVLHLS
jgi:hypothetical protein